MRSSSRVSSARSSSWVAATSRPTPSFLQGYAHTIPALIVPVANTKCKTNGVFEVEFQNQDARQLRVTENKNPAAAPKGFVALEPVSYVVELGGGAAAAQGLTLQKIDYIRNADSKPPLTTARECF